MWAYPRHVWDFQSIQLPSFTATYVNIFSVFHLMPLLHSVRRRTTKHGPNQLVVGLLKAFFRRKSLLACDGHVERTSSSAKWNVAQHLSKHGLMLRYQSFQTSLDCDSYATRLVGYADCLVYFTCQQLPIVFTMFCCRTNFRETLDWLVTSCNGLHSSILLLLYYLWLTGRTQQVVYNGVLSSNLSTGLLWDPASIRKIRHLSIL